MNSLQEKSNVFISGFMLSNFLQLINLEQKTCTLKVKSKNKVGYLYLNKGELVNAEADGMDGEKAATRIISWRNVQTEIQDTCQTERKVHTPLMHILLKSTHQADERGNSLIMRISWMKRYRRLKEITLKKQNYYSAKF